MKTLLRNLLIFGLSLTVSLPCVASQSDVSRGRQSHHSTTSGSSPSSSRTGTTVSRPSGRQNHTVGAGNRKPANTSHNNQSGIRPGNNNHGQSGIRPGNSGQPQGGVAPGGNNNRPQGGVRPGGNGNNSSWNHGHNNRPTTPPANHRPTPPPNAHHGWNNLHWGAPSRPWCPPLRPFHRPVPPPRNYHYYSAFPRISTILGVALGTAINIGINSLLYNGYNITGYGNDVVYLSNVAQLSYNWPDATMYFTNGVLTASEFLYSTTYNNISRYNNLYNRLISTYGTPYNVLPYGPNGASATWWSPNGQFIQLQYAPRYAADGSFRYFTTLSFGN